MPGTTRRRTSRLTNQPPSSQKTQVDAIFHVHYAVDDDEVPTVLSLDYYDGDDECSWLLLEPAELAVAECSSKSGCELVGVTVVS